MSVSKNTRDRKRVCVASDDRLGLEPRLVFGRLAIDHDGQGRGVGDARALFTPGEIAVLHALAASECPLRKDDLLARLPHDPAADARLIDAIVVRLRRKLALLGLPDLVATVWGTGYAADRDVAFAPGAPLMAFGHASADPVLAASA